MATDVIMPVLGMNQDSGVLLAWLVNEGDSVTEGEPLMEVETDKAVMEVEATASGTLVNVTAAAGDDIPTGTVIARIAAEDEEAPADGGAAAAEAADGGSGAAERDAAAKTADAGTAPPPDDSPETGAAGQGPAPSREDHGERVMASPKARRLAAERGVALATLQGSGPGGAVIAQDVLDAPAEDASEAVAAGEGSPEPRRAERADATAPANVEQLERSVDAGAVAALLERLAGRRDLDAPPTLTALLVKFAAAGARRRALFGDDEGPIDVRVRRGAADPVAIANAADLGLVALEARLRGDAENDDLAPNHLSLTVAGDLPADAVRAAPTGGAALAAGALEPRVVAVDGAPAVRPTLTLTMSYDPQRVAAARAAALFGDLVGLFADPTELVVLF